MTVAFLLPTIVNAERPYKTDQLKKDVRDSELVVHGIITGLDVEIVPYSQLTAPQAPTYGSPLTTGQQPAEPTIKKFPVTVVEVEINSIIKGSWSKSTVKAALRGDPASGGYYAGTTYNYEKGEEVILCLHYDPRVVGDGFLIYGDLGSFVKRDNTWLTRDGRSIVYFEDIQMISRALEPDNMTRDADVVAVGTIESLQTREFDCGFPIMCIADYVVFRVTKSWKGATTGETILVRALRRGTNLSWFAPVPELTVGESFMMFLKKDDVGLYPFAGYNGFLQIVDDELFLNAPVRHSLSKARLETIVQQEVERSR